MRLLLIEDNPDDALLVKESLAAIPGAPFEVEWVDRVSLGLEKLKSGGIDVVLTDLNLPDSTGRGLDTYLRLRVQAPNLPIVVLTGTEDESIGLEALKKGAQDFLPKDEVNSKVLNRIVRYAVERKQEEEYLQHAIAQLGAQKQALDQLAVVAETDPEGRITYVNDMFCKISQYSREEVMGKDHRNLVNSGYHPKSFWKNFWETISQGHVWRGEVKNRTKDGSAQWMDTSVVPFMGPDGKPQKYLAIRTVITERKQAEEALRQSEEQLYELNKDLEKQVAQRTELLLAKERELEQSRRLEAIGSLAGGVAHDFNNLLTGIAGIIQEAHDDLPKNDPKREGFDMALKAAQSAFALTRQLLAFSRNQIVTPQVMDLSARLSEFKKMLNRLIGEDIRLRTEFQVGIGKIKIDPGQLEQIVVNLAVNARDAMPEGGDLSIETAEHVQNAGTESPLPPGRYVRLSIRDTGHGMNRETVDRIFEPFFTTKGEKGTGLGLSTVYGIVKQNGGRIYVRSKEGEGTTFDLFFPNLGTNPPEEPKQEKRKAVLRGHETVLVVEDEKIVRHVVTGQLKRHGYNVLEASSGAEALELTEKLHESIQLLLTDVVMPGMNGRELAESLTQKRPGLAVLFMSGYSQDILDAKGIATGETHFIKKSYLNKDLLPKVREVLDGRKVPAS
jgi:PAS domain S-box-containing protein